MKKIHVGFLFSYDYEKLKISIPLVYNDADAIFLAVDEKFRTWSGQIFEVDDQFFEWIKQFDTQNKITIYRDNFYVPELSAIENDNRERYMLSLKMGIGNWLIQVDSDEYFLDFKKFVKDLRKHDNFLDDPENNRIQVAAFLINMFKYTDGGLLYVDKATRGLMATNYPDYKVARNTRQRIIYTRNLLWHETLSRTAEEIEYKFKNWGHNDEVNPDSFMQKWKSVNKNNYKSMRDFFYMEPEKWKKLAFVKGTTYSEIKNNIDICKVAPSNLYIWSKNIGQWFKHL
ncbi:hypothetical protein FLA105534_04240 [Flavobacterium bizetiae]|uniref:Glycosyltransferase 2-like domain-containing protein n=1 Tax=Flavobacterium bizetiae TaxID=2704140 RepID=A0A6J4GZ51_9FLAO|nr:hypothetical protein [Flavobacterium bizetiae]CAA9202726.1 hypothetical protein FLA105534_04240 [Flavobacterium bizetiae]CAD5344428.1 hypothetical protein FLA105535_04434 [Flavobacterium bizetiae]CAD5350348.1 hypothetical protein FLA105534_04338 [Flavobacterium bizetiae]